MAVKKQSKPSKGLRPPGNKKTGGKSFSKIAAEILTKTRGDKERATAKLKELGCPSASAIVGVQMRKLGYETSKKKGAVKAMKKALGGKVAKKIEVKKAGKKRIVEEDEDLEEEELEEDETEEEEEELEEDEF